MCNRLHAHYTLHIFSGIHVFASFFHWLSWLLNKIVFLCFHFFTFLHHFATKVSNEKWVKNAKNPFKKTWCERGHSGNRPLLHKEHWDTRFREGYFNGPDFQAQVSKIIWTKIPKTSNIFHAALEPQKWCQVFFFEKCICLRS